MRRFIRGFLISGFLFLALLVVSTAFPPPYDFTSQQDGDWQVSSTWNESGSPDCATDSRILIDGDTVTANCAIEVSGNGYILIQNQGYLKVKESMTVTGQGEVEVADNAGMRVEGDMTVNGQGDFTTNGETDVTGNLEVNGANATADGSGSLSLGGTGCSNFSGSGNCNEAAPLPVKLLEFKAQGTNKGISLTWSTATEDRNDKFIVQRSADGMDYQKIEEVQGHGTTSQEHRYEYLDEEAPKGDPYYRLIQVDLDGERTIYGPRTARYEGRNKADCNMKIVPNPCRGNCRIQFEGDCENEEGRLSVQLYDVAGNRTNANIQRTGGFDSEFMIDTDRNLSPGVYVVRAVSDKGTVASEKMKKE